MSTSLSTAIQSLSPFERGIEQEEIALRTLRLGALMAATFNLVFWGVYRLTTPEAFDPLAARLAVVGVSALTLAWSYVEGPVRRHPRATLALAVHGLLVWYGVLTGVNGLETNYAVGYYFFVVSGAMLYSLAWRRAWPMAVMLLSAVAVAGIVASTADLREAQVSPAMFLLTLGAGMGIVYLAFIGRLRAVCDLEQSEAQLVDAERLAGTGSWTLSVRSGRARWSAGVYEILGVPPSRRPYKSAADFVHPEDLQEVTSSTQRLVERGGEVDQRFRIIRPDGEVRVVRAFKRLQRDESGAPRRIKGAYIDVTDQVRHEASLEAARDRAEAAAEAKATFLANMSHEIRTPLTAIIGFAQMLSEEVGEEHADLVQPIESGGRRLLDTLNSVLDLARMEAGETDLRLGVVDLACEARDVAQMLRPQAEAKGITLAVDAPSRGLDVVADAAALARVLTNLLSNAVKFTDEGGITVSLRRAGEAVEAVIDDTGRGMDAAFLAEVFEPFRQASSGWARSHEGTGIGLTITQQLVEAMGGTIDVTSTVGVGSRFVVTLPTPPEGDERDGRELAAPASALELVAG